MWNADETKGPGSKRFALPVENGVYQIDLRDGTTRGCRVMAEMFGVPAAELAAGIDGQRIVDRIHDDDRQRALETVNASIAKGGIYLDTYRTAALGENVRVNVMGFCFRDGQDHPLSLVGTLTKFGPGDNAALHEGMAQNVLAAYRAAAKGGTPFQRYLLTLLLTDIGFVLPGFDCPPMSLN